MPTNIYRKVIARLRVSRWISAGDALYAIPMQKVRQDLEKITDPQTRERAMQLFDHLVGCSTVMKLDPAHYAEAVGAAVDMLVRFLSSHLRDDEEAPGKGRGESDLAGPNPAP
jgi:hypothetical protein